MYRSTSTHDARPQKGLFNRAMTTIIAAALLSTSYAASAADFPVPSGTYELENTHGYITFSYSHLGFSTPHVGFNEFDVTLNADSDNPEKSAVSVTINAASIDSRVEEFDKHLVGADYFDTANHPTITFESTSITAGEGNTFTVVGDLTIKGVTESVTLDATVNKAANHPMRRVPTIGLSASGKLLRSKWGLGNYAPAVGDEVTIYLSVELIKP